LSFRYDGNIIDAIKDGLRTAQRLTQGRNLGGWLPEYRCWFCERVAWPWVRKQLQQAGHSLEGDPIQAVLKDHDLIRLIAGATADGRLDQASALVLADFLEERGDERAVKARELAEGRMVVPHLLGLFV